MSPRATTSSQNRSSTPSQPDQAAAPGVWWFTTLSLRQRTLLLVGFALLLLLFVLFVPLSTIMISNATSMERAGMLSSLDRITALCSTQLDQLTTITRSYALWDESYQFIAGTNPTFVDENLKSEFFLTEQRNLLLIADRDGQILISKAVTNDGQVIEDFALTGLPPAADNLLFRHTDANDLHRGLIATSHGVMLIVSAPIQPEGDPATMSGSLVMGRFFHPEHFAAFIGTPNTTITTYRVDDPQLPSHLRERLNQLIISGAPQIAPSTDQTIAGYNLIRDIYDQPALIVQVSEQRIIYQQGQWSTTYLVIALVSAGFVFGVMILLMLEYLVLARLSRLSHDLRRIGRSADLTRRVTLSGHDELSNLATTINEMLDDLDQAQAERQRISTAEARLREEIELLHTRRQLIARVSHEMRTPLTPIKGFVDIMLLDEAGQLTPRQRRSLEIVRDNTDRLTSLIDDLLELGRAEAGKLHLIIQPINLRTTIGAAVEVLQSQLAAKSMQLTIQVADDLPLIEADDQRIMQILTNLISNAIKYTYTGGTITISARPFGDQEVEIKVHDTGVGMTPEQQRQLFTPFFRAESPLHTAGNGTGLGLLIARTMVELHRGQMLVESESGVGSIFSVILPVRQG